MNRGTSRQSEVGASERVRSVTSAYVYGNVLVLGAVLGVGSDAVLDGDAVIAVLVTTFTTYLAHVLAHDVAERLGHSSAEHERAVRDELRDAVPILVSGGPPALVLGGGALGLLGVELAQVLAAGIVVARLAATGWRVERLSGGPPSPRALWSGFALAVAGALIAGIKVAFGR